MRRLHVWLVLGWLAVSASSTAPTPSRPTGSGAIETVRGRLSVNPRSWRRVSGTRLDEPLAPSDVREAGLCRRDALAVVSGWIGHGVPRVEVSPASDRLKAALVRQDGAGGVVSPNSSVI